MPKPLTIKQERFCEWVIQGESATQAYLKAGYAGDYKTADKTAFRLMGNEGIKARIAELRKPETRKALETKDSKRSLLAKKINDETVPLALRLRAIEIDSKLAGHYEPEKITIETGDNTLQFLQERAKQVMSGLNKFTQNPPTQ